MTHVLIFFLAVASGDIGVIDMALLSVIRRWHFRDGMPIREIERRTGLSRNTIRKYLRSGAIEPKFKGGGRPSKLDPFAGKLSSWLQIETGKSRKQRRTVRQMHADLVVLGFEGSYNRVAEPPRVCRRLQLLRRWSLYEQDNEQNCSRHSAMSLRAR